MSTREGNARAQERKLIGFSCVYERCGARLGVNCSQCVEHCVAPRIWTVKCELGSTEELTVSVQEICGGVERRCSGVGKALRIFYVNVTREQCGRRRWTTGNQIQSTKV